jgi:hypothetical protein
MVLHRDYQKVSKNQTATLVKFFEGVSVFDASASRRCQRHRRVAQWQKQIPLIPLFIPAKECLFLTPQQVADANGIVELRSGKNRFR